MDKILHEEDINSLSIRKGDTLRLTFKDEDTGRVLYEKEHDIEESLEVNHVKLFQTSNFLGFKKCMGAVFGEKHE